MREGIPLLRPTHSWSAIGRAIACTTARMLRPDVIHIQEEIHSFHETDAAVRLGRATAAAVVTTLHEYHTELPSVVYTNELVRLSRIVVSNDPRNAARCLEQTGRAVDRHGWSGSPIDPPEPSRRPATRPGLVVTFGFLSAIKSMTLLHAALARLRETYPQLHWRIIGPYHPETDPHHAELARTLTGDWIEFTGAVSAIDEPEKLRLLLGEAAIMILPFADGASLRRTTLHAAWAFGLPVVTTAPPVATDAVVDGENCLLVREASIEAWSEAIARVLSDPDLADRLRMGSLRTAEHYSGRRLAAEHLEMYESLLGL